MQTSSSKQQLILSLAALFMFILFLGARVNAAGPASVTLVGDLQSELGCPGDWQPDCANTFIAEQGYNVWRGEFAVPVGNWEYKMALNGTWDESYPGANVALVVADATPTRFYFDYKTKAVLDSVNDVIAVAAGSFQDQIGCPNIWQPWCVNSLLNDKNDDGIYELFIAPGDLANGDYEFKVALDEDWAESYPGSNVPFTVDSADKAVTITYDSADNSVTVDVSVPYSGPASVTLAGSLQSELGCSGDWQPDCATTHLALQGYDVWRGEFAVPEGSYAYKMALNDSWDEAYPASDKPITVPAAAPDTRFYFDYKTTAVLDSINDVIAVAAGSMQSELGCADDWQPWCVNTLLTDVDGDGVYAFVSTDIPAGDYEFKVALDEDWAESYPGSNVPFSVTENGEQVTITYDSADNSVEVTVGGGDVDLSVTAPLLSYPIQGDVFYFGLTDRFYNGDTANDEGANPGGTLAETGYKPDDISFYHGGDLVGMTSMLDYIDNLGASAIWITPVFGNVPTGPDSSTTEGFAGSYHGYWILDYENADAHLGTNTELQAFIDAAHARGMKVFFDIVVNHTADVIDYAEAEPHNYISKDDVPYRDADGNEFDDRDYAGTGDFPPLDAATSFPYTPEFGDPGDDTAKNPAWLNDLTLYHNRGNSTFAGESSQYGDFFGLDDTFTEHYQVVDGFTAIFKDWITNYDIDGYRLDTVKHVNIEFWQEFAGEIMDHAAAEGKTDFYMFGEVFDGNAANMSVYTTEGTLPSVLDFGMHGNANGFAVNGNATDNLRDYFANDDYFTDADSNAYGLANFISNHDIGRIGHGLRNAAYPDDEALARTELGHALMYFARGFPVVYYGDEQGFVGGGNDKLSREDMFASLVDEYNSNDLIGTDATTADDNFDETHPIFTTLADYADVRDAHVALQRGAQIHRYSTGSAGVYAFSRIDRDERVEYLVVLNNANSEQTASFDTYSADTAFTQLYPGGAGLVSDSDGAVTVTIPAFGAMIFQADSALACGTEAAAIAMSAPVAGAAVDGRIEVAADVSELTLTEVTFAVSIDGGVLEIIGTDANAPYRVFYDTSDIAADTPIVFQAVADDLCGNLSGASVEVVKGEDQTGSDAPPYTIIHYNRPLGDYGDHTTGNWEDFWGLHLWGDAIDPSEVTEWMDPKPFLGETEFGRFAYIKLDNNESNVNFIIHKGNDKDTPDDRFYDPAVTPEIWVNQGDATIYPTQALAQGLVTFHYNRPGGDYDGWGLHLWQDGWGTEWTMPHLADDFDDYGAVYIVDTTTYPDFDLTQPLNFIMHNGDEKDPPDSPDRVMDPNETPSIWLKQGEITNYESWGHATDTATLHYRRPAGDYGDYTSSDYNDFWGLHTWGAAADPGWTTPRIPVDEDVFGVVFEVPLLDPSADMGYILHRGDEKDPGPDQFLNFDTWGFEVWQVQAADPAMPYVYPILYGPPGPGGDIDEQSAYWVLEDTIAWDADSDAYELIYAAEGGMTLDAGLINGADGALTLTYDPAGLPTDVQEKFPHLANLSAYTISADDLALVPAILTGQFAVTALNGDGLVVDAAGLQIPGVLDDLYTYDGALGVTFDTTRSQTTPTISVWAPTAKNVTLHLFADADPATTSTTFPMSHDPATGVWSVAGDAGWYGQYYLFEIEVYVPSTGQVEHNMVTDPYSFSLSMNSARSQIVDLSDPALKPAGWDTLEKPPLTAPEEIAVYELHVRDFSIFDESVPEEHRGKYLAFTYDDTDGMRHLQALADAGLTHLHLLPVFDIATINENEAERTEPDPDELALYPPNSEEQQAIITALAPLDGFNWGYDPFHYTTPEGSYATDPNGTQRILEFRQMVQSLNEHDLRVVMDVVYNHTNASGQSEKSVLDRVVPGYYHRLDDKGNVEKSTCCENTASEHNMMEKLMIDSLLVWATEYKIDAFRFDLMGHHMKRNMLAVRDALDALTIPDNGVDGEEIYMYGEGWNFGEVADNARGENATQLNMAGTGIGTFSDRLRDAVRGGGPFDDGDALQNQGFGNGLHTDPNDYNQGDTLSKLLLATDQIRVGMAGNLADYEFIDRNGNLVTGADVDYNGQPAGYTDDPQEVITYISKHDNQTLYDINVYGLPVATSMADRVRMQNVGLSTVMLGQGVPFFHAGVDMLRSKSLDRDSFDSGDWFNRLDFTYAINNFGVGLPVESKNGSNWYLMDPLLANPDLMPDSADIGLTNELFRELLAIRYSTPLFHLETAQEVMDKVAFHNTGPDQIPGLLVMTITDRGPGSLDSNVNELVILINATPEEQTFSADYFNYRIYHLHPVNRNSVDPVVRTASFDRDSGTFTIPARTAAVFVDGYIPTAVELISFDAAVVNGTVNLTWSTAAEVNNAGFNLYRRNVASGVETRINDLLIASQSAAGSGADYAFSDTPNIGLWEYTLEEVETDGTATRIAAVAIDTQAPTSAQLSQFDGNNGNIAPLVLALLLPFVAFALWLMLRRRQDALQ
ncbi:MAG: pullulanase-type alpha-1,6-glucosidase [Anaerolineae bacterium]|nr:pullulanase-type alpha-1,6-glucosidase [Anaerolineae bacterium]